MLTSLSSELQDGRDRFVASDPGRARLRQAMRATVAVGSTLVVERILALVIDVPALMLILVGAVVALPMATGIRETRRKNVLQVAAGSPVAAVVGVVFGVVAGPHRVIGLVLFVIVSFSGVWVRRFGPRWFHYGFLLWQTYFFSLFLHPPISQLGPIVLATLVATTWVTLLLSTVLHSDPEARLRGTVTALRARARAVVSACLDVLDDPADSRARRALRTHRLQFSEVALLVDGQLADERALPRAVPPGRLRRWTVDLETGMDQLCGAVLRVAADTSVVPGVELDQIRALLRHVGWGEQAAADEAAASLSDSGSTALSRRLAVAALALLTTVDQWDSGGLRLEPAQMPSDGSDISPAPTDDPLDGPDFEAVVLLTGGNLPGVASLAERSVRRAESRRWSTSRLRLTTRQAVQAGTAAGLAILAGELISSQRYYWAVIAAFVGFAGTATAGETLRKGVARVMGTLAGLVAAVGLADLTASNTNLALAMTLVCIFFAFYLQGVSYAAMIFFITLMLGQLYTLLHTLSDQLLLIRLEETAVGALIGIAVAFVVLPAGARATLRAARAAFMESLADLLDASAVTLRGGAPTRDLLAQAIQLNAAARQVARTNRGLTYGRVFGGDRTGIRHRVTMLGVCGTTGRALAAALSMRPVRSEQLALASDELSAECRRLAEVPQLFPPSALPEGMSPVAERVLPLLELAESTGADPGTQDCDVGSVAAILRRLTETLNRLGREPPR